MNNAQQLVTACLGGDEHAFEKLVNRYRYPVFGLCLGYVGDFDVAEDMAQETFVSAYMNLHSLADPKFLGPWLKRIAINRCRSQWRRGQRLTALDNEPEEVWHSKLPSVEERMIAGEKRLDVLKSMDRLPEAQRQVLVLFYLEDLSLRQIAAFLGIREASAKQRLYRARLALKEEMLEMIKETVGGHELPPDFTEQVVKEALAQGKKKLSQRDWQGAQDAFRKVVDVVPEHLEGNRGLGLSLGGEVEHKQRDAVFDNDELAQEAFETLTRAYELGATDDGVVRRLARLYSNFGRNREGGQFLERVAEARSGWREKIRYLQTAISVYYHSHYRNGEDNKVDCVRCHRKMRSLVPVDSDVRLKLAAWCPAGMALAYAHVGLADEVCDEMNQFEQTLGQDCSVWDHFYIALIRSNTHRELEQWEEMVDVGRAFVDWIEQLLEGDARFHTPLETIRKDDVSEAKRVGEWVRWHVTGFMLNTVVRAENALGRDVGETLKQIDHILRAHEDYVADFEKTENESQTAEAWHWLGRGYTRAGEAAFLTHQFEKTLAYYVREEELLGQLDMHGSIYRVGALSALGKVGEAVERLDGITGRLVSTGQWRTVFDQHRAFDAIREDKRVVRIMDRWKIAEGIMNG